MLISPNFKIFTPKSEISNSAKPSSPQRMNGQLGWTDGHADRQVDEQATSGQM